MSLPDAEDYALSRAAIFNEGYKELLAVHDEVLLRYWRSHLRPLLAPKHCFNWFSSR
jgi:hypothetical protein